ncbi:biotin transporter BioY, partial [Streptomyces sp. SID5475]|nr:biotin transporter BioY [Streptomyces sp. SID5475]
MSTAAVTRTHRPGAVLADLLPAATATRARLRDAALVV